MSSRPENTKSFPPKKTRQVIKRGIDGIPIVPLEVKRPSLYKAVLSGGSGKKRILSQGVERVKELVNPNRLKIVAGTARGRKINSPDVYLRPMMAKVREALFSTLKHIGLFETNSTKILDIFAGSGSVGLEALSRGAAHATFVDFNQNCIETALNNAEICGFQYQVKGVCAKAEEVLTYPSRFGLFETYQLICLTPPYEEVVYKELINAICNSPLVEEDTIVMIEYPIEMGKLPYIIDNKLYGVRNRRYGRTVIATYAYKPTKKLDMRPDEFEL